MPSSNRMQSRREREADTTFALRLPARRKKPDDAKSRPSPAAIDTNARRRPRPSPCGRGLYYWFGILFVIALAASTIFPTLSPTMPRPKGTLASGQVSFSPWASSVPLLDDIARDTATVSATIRDRVTAAASLGIASGATCSDELSKARRSISAVEDAAASVAFWLARRSTWLATHHSRATLDALTGLWAVIDDEVLALERLSECIGTLQLALQEETPVERDDRFSVWRRILLPQSFDLETYQRLQERGKARIDMSRTLDHYASQLHGHVLAITDITGPLRVFGDGLQRFLEPTTPSPVAWTPQLVVLHLQSAVSEAWGEDLTSSGRFELSGRGALYEYLRWTCLHLSHLLGNRTRGATR